MGMTILEGSTFCICDEIGDLDGRTSGFFAEDTRFLSRLELRVNGARPLLLSSGTIEYFSAAFYLRNPVAEGLVQDSLSIARERFVGDGMQDHLVVRNETAAPLRFELALDVGTDFADIISVKEHDFALGDPLHARPLPPPAAVRDDGANQLVLEEQRRQRQDAGAALASRARSRARASASRSSSQPRERWELRVDVVPSLTGEESLPLVVERRFGEGRAHVQDSLDAWRLQVPRLRTPHDGLARSFAQSVADLAALRMRTDGSIGMLPAAGMPWFMTVFGRDTLITSLQTMLLGPELAIASLDALAALQAREDDPSIDAEPGKILARAPPRPCRGDLVRHLLRHRRRDAALPDPALGGLALERRPGGRRAAARAGARRAALDRRVRRPRRRRLRRVRAADAARAREPVVEGLGRLAALPRRRAIAKTPIAPVEVQGYVYDAKLRMAELARAVWADDALAARLEAEAAELQTPLRRAVLGRGARRLLRARARRREAAGRLALLEHRPPALERDRSPGAGRRDRAPADGRRALVGQGDPDDVDRGRRLQPAQPTTTARSGPTTRLSAPGACGEAAMPATST